MGFADKAVAHSLVLFHHDPYHTDDELDAPLADARGRWDGAHEQVCLAHEGMKSLSTATGALRRLT